MIVATPPIPRAPASVFALACPKCCGGIIVEQDQARCQACNAIYSRVNGIWRFLLPARAEYHTPFLDPYQRVRKQERWGADDAAYYRRLPRVPRADPHHSIWRVRAKNFTRLLDFIGNASSLRVLDIGAGNGWLSNQLASRGHIVVAVDLSNDTRDGLGAHENYDHAFECYQAEFERLPFADAQFDLAIFNASLHYSMSLWQTIFETRRVLALNGNIVVMDSPFYSNAASGESMRIVLHARALVPGFITLDQLHAAGREANLELHTRYADAEWHKRVRRQFIAWKLKREPARFPILILSRS